MPWNIVNSCNRQKPPNINKDTPSELLVLCNRMICGKKSAALIKSPRPKIVSITFCSHMIKSFGVNSHLSVLHTLLLDVMADLSLVMEK
jgi:hypothetical protein